MRIYSVCCNRDILQNPSKICIIINKSWGCNLILPGSPRSLFNLKAVLHWILLLRTFTTIKEETFLCSSMLSREAAKLKNDVMKLSLWKNISGQQQLQQGKNTYGLLRPLRLADGWTSKPTFGLFKMLIWLITGNYFFTPNYTGKLN